MIRPLPPRRRLWLAAALLGLLAPAVAYAYTMCHEYSDGCTICDFYSDNDNEHQGSIEWCH